MRTGAEDQISLSLLRHGATRSNEEGRYLGRTDEPLSETGKEQLLRLKEMHSFGQPDILFSGPMRRCRQTAELVYGLDPILIPEWTEIDFGRFEGKNNQELGGDPSYQAWIDSNAAMAFPEGENPDDFILRSMRGFDRMWMALTDYKKQTGRDVKAAAVVHGGTVMAILSTLTGGDYFDFQIKNGEGFSFLLEADGEQGIRVSEVTKLG